MFQAYIDLHDGWLLLPEIVPDKADEALVFLVHARRHPEIAVLAVDRLDALEEDLLHLQPGRQDLGGGLAGHRGVDEHVVAVRREGLQADLSPVPW